MGSTSIVWLKRDLRLSDHLPFYHALHAGQPLLILYIFEPELLGDEHYDERHWRFIWESLEDMSQVLQGYGHSIHICFGSVVEVLNHVFDQFPEATLLSHQETGIRTTYDRDRAVAQLCSARGVDWKEFGQDGVFRGWSHREKWFSAWREFIHQRIQPLDWSLVGTQEWEVPEGFRLPGRYEVTWSTPNDAFQKGGCTRAWAEIKELTDRGAQNYMKSISKPAASRDHCSRLSPYLAWGSISIREVYQCAAAQLPKGHNRSGFLDRLRWRSHFIQKFEMEDRKEFEHVNRGYEHLSYTGNPEHFLAWKKGETGFPMVDACMKCLEKTGYINFRMRAMLVSFLTHHLFLDWRNGVHHLAQMFLDFEPGIHYAQFQMQAGVTGINTLRVYNPIKQSQDHDPEGVFLKRWLPGLENLPGAFIHEPWKMTMMEKQWYGQEIPSYYFNPIIAPDELGKGREALWAMKKDPRVIKDGQRVLKRLTNPGRRNA